MSNASAAARHSPRSNSDSLVFTAGGGGALAAGAGLALLLPRAFGFFAGAGCGMAAIACGFCAGAAWASALESETDTAASGTATATAGARGDGAIGIFAVAGSGGSEPGALVAGADSARDGASSGPRGVRSSSSSSSVMLTSTTLAPRGSSQREPLRAPLDVRMTRDETPAAERSTFDAKSPSGTVGT